MPRRSLKWSITYRIGSVPHFGAVSDLSGSESGARNEIHRDGSKYSGVRTGI